MKVYDFIGTLLFKNKLFKHNWQKKRKLNRSPGIGCIKGFLHSARADTLPSVEKTRRKKFFAKKNLKSYVLYLATIKILFCVCLAHARQQGLGSPVATGVALSTDSIVPLQIGDTIPDALWNLPLQTIKAGQGGSITVRLNDYKRKLIILDFWSTWCGSCIASMPKVDKLSKRYADDIRVFSITQQSENVVIPFLKKNRFVNGTDLPFVADDTILSKAFPHIGLPHIAWIFNGVLVATTSTNQLTELHISKVLAGQQLQAPLKIDATSFYNDPLVLLNPRIAELEENRSSQLVYTAITGYVNGINSTRATNGDDTLQGFKMVSFRNRAILDLYRIALGKGDTIPVRRIRWEVDEPERYAFWMSAKDGLTMEEWLAKFSVCYEARLPIEVPDAVVRNKMFSDLNHFLNLNVKVEKYHEDCWIIKRNEKQIGKKINAKGNFQYAIGQIARQMNKNDSSLAVMLEVNPNDRIHTDLDLKAMNTRQLKILLETNGYKIVTEKRALDYLIFKKSI